MLDVHPPHQAAHTWKDFFIHIATIVIGLLIAVGLEQTVERLHNAEVRKELQKELQGQSHGNSSYIREDVRIAEGWFDWAQQQRQTLQAAKPSTPIVFNMRPADIVLFPDTGVWLAAKDNGRTALLTTEEQVWYSDLYRMEQRAFAPEIGAHDRLVATLSQLDKTLLPHVQSFSTDKVTLSPLTADQVSSVQGALLGVQEAARDLDRELLVFDAANSFLNNTQPGHWFDDLTSTEYLSSRRTNFAAHPRSAYLFSAK